ncbi:MAG: XTP/dITP diphosphohydrolase [Candidatus Nanohaloarchaea archaeon]|jgi:XTP/dITP diphosphohydrolase
MKPIFFATGNEGKLEEMEPPFREAGYELVQVEADVPEIDAMDVEEVAKRKVMDSYQEAVLGQEIGSVDYFIVEDTGFYVEALDGFPGAEAAFFAGTAGAERLLDLMEGEEDRSAYFRTAIAVYMPGRDEIEIFTGKMTGKIPEEKRGKSHPHLPYNSYFIPDHGNGESLAENEELKNEEMHRRKAVNSFIDWLNDRE